MGKASVKLNYYKYRALYDYENGKQVKSTTESIFTTARLYYGAPVSFNDPFDCNLKVHVDDSTDAEWEAYVEKIIDQNPSSSAALQKVKTGKLWKTHPELIRDIGADAHKKHYIDSSVLCLTKKSNSIPMFSYYADSHKGIAIEFSFSDMEVPCGFSYVPSKVGGIPYDGKVVFRDVEYQQTFPDLNYHRISATNPDRIVRSLIFTKSAEWAHENEFRIFRRNIPSSTVCFDRTLLTKVVFGCKTDQADVDLVKKWLKGWPSAVTLAKTDPNPRNFELDIHDIEIV